ncbi:FAD-dependent monooxygenase [Amycolatopsis anabasis]|uniref:FAD-dependent monooxygenase n=1 Tax=Amycolatopsis anabasis TaxID=1840409 RepID=UPI00131A9346|nr:FAD-dependent monooxygenase [Amycolatopsis anabasis]
MVEIETGVLVAGAGPTGLMLANELALAGVEVVVLEKLPARSGQSKALNLQPRTAEVFDLRGLMDDALSQAIATIGGGHFGGHPLSYADCVTRHPYQVGIPQARVEQVLEARLAEYGVAVRWGHELVDFAQDDSGVTALVRTPEGELRIRAACLAGCDGGRSAVRKRLGVGFPGHDASRVALVADVVIENAPATVPKHWRSMRDVLKAGSGNDGFTEVFGGLIPLGEPGVFRLAYGNLNGGAEGRDDPVTAEEVASAVRRCYGEDAVVSEVRWASRFTNATRQVDRYRVGRVLLAGDAAHIHFPAGGQGLNLGVQDAMNLGWKLAAEMRGWAPDGLLDTYHAERHAVGADVLENTLAQMLPPQASPETRAMHRLIRTLADLPQGQRFLVGMVSGLDIRYPIDAPPHPMLGARWIDVELEVDGDRRWSSELLRTGRGVLFSVDSRHLVTAKPWADRVDAISVPELPGVDADAVLIRPDGYVAWAGDGEGLEASLRTWFGGMNNVDGFGE